MEGVRQWAIAVCSAAILCTILRQIFPDNRVGEQGRMLLPCVFLCVLLSPISGLSSGVKIPDFTAGNAADTGDLTQQMQSQITAQVNTTLLEMVNQALDGYGWSAKKVEAQVDIAADGSISIGQIVLYVDEDVARRATAVAQVAEKRLGTAVEVAVWQD